MLLRCRQDDGRSPAPPPSVARGALMSRPASAFFFMLRIALKSVGRSLPCVLFGQFWLDPPTSEPQPTVWLLSGSVMSSLLHCGSTLRACSSSEPGRSVVVWGSGRVPGSCAPPGVPKAAARLLLSRVLHDVPSLRKGRDWICGGLADASATSLGKEIYRNFLRGPGLMFSPTAAR